MLYYLADKALILPCLRTLNKSVVCVKNNKSLTNRQCIANTPSLFFDFRV